MNLETRNESKSFAKRASMFYISLDFGLARMEKHCFRTGGAN